MAILNLQVLRPFSAPRSLNPFMLLLLMFPVVVGAGCTDDSSPEKGPSQYGDDVKRALSEDADFKVSPETMKALQSILSPQCHLGIPAFPSTF